jgi:hypothetical protein
MEGDDPHFTDYRKGEVKNLSKERPVDMVKLYEYMKQTVLLLL